MGHLISYLRRRFQVVIERMQRTLRRLRDPQLFHLHYHQLIYDISSCSYCREEFNRHWFSVTSNRLRTLPTKAFLRNANKEKPITASAQTNNQVPSSLSEEASKRDTSNTETLTRQRS